MGFPGTPGSQIPDGIDWIPRRFTDIERTIRELAPSVAASIRPTVARLDASDATLAAQVAGLAAVVAQVVKPQSVNFKATNFACTIAGAVRASQTITVPAGYSQAVVSVVTRVFVKNPNTTGGFDGLGADAIYTTAQIDTVAGNAHGILIPGSNGSDISVDALSTVLTGLHGGDTFPLMVNVASQSLNWTAQTQNAAEMSGSILWLK